jgi:hypothetical protein
MGKDTRLALSTHPYHSFEVIELRPPATYGSITAQTTFPNPTQDRYDHLATLTISNMDPDHHPLLRCRPPRPHSARPARRVSLGQRNIVRHSDLTNMLQQIDRNTPIEMTSQRLIG